MKAVKFTILLVLLTSLLSCSGCLSKKYVYDFRTEMAFTRDDGTWSTHDSDYSFDEDGLLINDCWAAAPHFYNGDFTLTWEFSLDVAGGNTEVLEFYLSSKAGWESADWYGGIAFHDMGTPSATYLTYYNPGTGIVFLDFDMPYAGILDEDGLNKVQIKKVGNWLTFKVNGKDIGDGFQITGYSTYLFCPNLWCFQDMEDRSIIFRSIEVRYSGDQVLRL